MDDTPSFRPNAHLDDLDEFKQRVEYGLIAQNMFIEHLDIRPLNSDYKTFQEDMPSVKHPKPDFEFQTCLFEIRRQDFYDPVLLGYAKKYDSWKRYADLVKKILYFCMISKNLERLAFANLTTNHDYIYKKENPVGDIDYCLSIRFFQRYAFDIGMDIIRGIIQNEQKKETVSDWMSG